LHLQCNMCKKRCFFARHIQSVHLLHYCRILGNIIAWYDDNTLLQTIHYVHQTFSQVVWIRIWTGAILCSVLGQSTAGSDCLGTFWTGTDLCLAFTNYLSVKPWEIHSAVTHHNHFGGGGITQYKQIWQATASASSCNISAVWQSWFTAGHSPYQSMSLSTACGGGRRQSTCTQPICSALIRPTTQTIHSITWALCNE